MQTKTKTNRHPLNTGRRGQASKQQAATIMHTELAKARKAYLTMDPMAVSANEAAATAIQFYFHAAGLCDRTRAEKVGRRTERRKFVVVHINDTRYMRATYGDGSDAWTISDIDPMAWEADKPGRVWDERDGSVDSLLNTIWDARQSVPYDCR